MQDLLCKMTSWVRCQAETDFCFRVRITSSFCERVTYPGLHCGLLKNYNINSTSKFYKSHKLKNISNINEWIFSKRYSQVTTG